MCDAFDIYDYIFNAGLKEVDIDYILNSDPSKTFHVVYLIKYDTKLVCPLPMNYFL